MKKQILLLTSFLVIAVVAIIAMPNNVYAAFPEEMSEEFKSILNEEGQLVITDSNNCSGKDVLLLDFLNKYQTEEYFFYPWSHNEDYTQIKLQRCVVENGTVLEEYDIDVVYDERYSDQFKLVTEDGNIVITDSSCFGKESLIYRYCQSFSTEAFWFEVVFPENGDSSTCTIRLNERNMDDTSKIIEQHIVNISYNEVFSENFQKITKDGNLLITDSCHGTKRDLIQSYCNRFSDDRYQFYVSPNTDQTAFTLEMYDYEKNYELVEQHILNVTFEEKFSDDFKKIFNNGDGNILITSTGLDGNASLVMQYLNMFDNDEYSFSLTYDEGDDSSYTVLMDKIEDDRYVVVEQHAVNVTFEEKFSDEFKKLFNNGDGKIVIKASRDYAKGDLIWNYCYALSNDKYNFNTMYEEENTDFTQCVIIMDAMIGDPKDFNFKTVEQHIVEISYDKTMSDDFKSHLNADGKYVINSVKPTSEDQIYCMLEILLLSKNDGTGFGYVSEDFSSFELTILDSKGYPETHKVEAQYNYDKEVKKVADEIVKKFPDDIESFKVRDMEIVNYWLHAGEEDLSGAGKLDNYSGELKSYLGHKNFNFMIDHRLGADDDFYTLRGGIGLLQHNGIVYYTNPYINVSADHILYVPDDTASTQEALLAAVQKRVDEYAGEGKVKITAGKGSIKDYYKNYPDIKIPRLQEKLNAEKAKENPDQDAIFYYEAELNWYKNDYEVYYNDYFLEEFNNPEGDYYFLHSAEGGYWFVATINGEDYEFIVVKDSDKMINPTQKTVDLNTNIQISTTSTSVPLDTRVEAQKLTSGEKYDKVIEVLNTQNVESYDLKLYSNSLGENITELKDGTFEVKLPMPDKFKGKTADELKIYYVDEDDNNKVYEYDVKFEDNDKFVVFTTDHFSIYTLSEKLALNTGNDNDGEEGNNPNAGGNTGSGEAEDDDANKNDGTTGGSDKNNNGETPETGDNIFLFVSMLLISVVGMAVSIKNKK